MNIIRDHKAMIRWSGEKELIQRFPLIPVKQVLMARLDWHLIENYVTTYGPIDSVKIGRLIERDVVGLLGFLDGISMGSSVKVLNIELELESDPMMISNNITMNLLVRNFRLMYQEGVNLFFHNENSIKR